MGENQPIVLTDFKDKYCDCDQIHEVEIIFDAMHNANNEGRDQ